MFHIAAFYQFADLPDYEALRDRVAALGAEGDVKGTAHLIGQGFEEVYQLEGGILKYLEVMDPEKSLWNGECYVFDRRVSVGHST